MTPSLFSYILGNSAQATYSPLPFVHKYSPAIHYSDYFYPLSYPLTFHANLVLSEKVVNFADVTYGLMLAKSMTLDTSTHHLKVFIIDDEIVHAQTLCKDLQTFSEIASVKCFNTPTEAALPLLEDKPDVIFLDVEMPGKNGIEFWDSINGRINFPVRIVFYSAYSNYILDALRRSAFDFLLKPYKIEELKYIVDRLVAGITATEPVHIAGAPMINKTLRKIAVQTINNLTLLTVEEMLYFQFSKSHRSWLLTLTDRTTLRLHQNTTAESILRLHPSLAKVSSGIIINLIYLAAIENNSLRCRLCTPFDDIELYASRRYCAKLKDTFDFI